MNSLRIDKIKLLQGISAGKYSIDALNEPIEYIAVNWANNGMYQISAKNISLSLTQKEYDIWRKKFNDLNLNRIHQHNLTLIRVTYGLRENAVNED
jgi:hypothetical protein